MFQAVVRMERTLVDGRRGVARHEVGADLTLRGVSRMRLGSDLNFHSHRGVNPVR
jgi:hypothetical protein